MNGDVMTLARPVTLEGLLAMLQIDPRRVAVEHNGVVVKRERYASARVEDGDRVEIVNFVGGGLDSQA